MPPSSRSQTVSLSGRIGHGLGGRERRGEQVGFLVVAGTKTSTVGRLCGSSWGALRERQRAGDDEEAEEQHHDAVHLGQIEQEAGDEVRHLGDGRQGAGGAPEDVAQHDGGAERQGDQAPDALGAKELDDDHAGHDREARNEMCLKADGKSDERDNQDRRHRPKGHDKTLLASVRFSAWICVGGNALIRNISRIY